MKRINYFIAFLLLSVIFSCNSQKKTYSPEGTNLGCSYCDSLLNGGYYIDYPFREVDKNTEGIPLIKNAENIKKDSFHVLTEYEVQEIQDNLFCFFGMEESMVDNYFHSSFRRNEWDTDDVSHKSKGYNFNMGNYVNKASRVYQTVEKADANTEFWLQGGMEFRLEFTKLKDEFIYTGTRQDSINLRDCIEKEKKK